jgi:hypothetical protein
MGRNAWIVKNYINKMDTRKALMKGEEQVGK